MMFYDCIAAMIEKRLLEGLNTIEMGIYIAS